MPTSTTVSFTANDGELVVGLHHYGPPAELTSLDFKTRDAVAYAAAMEFMANGTASGTVTVTAAA